VPVFGPPFSNAGHASLFCGGASLSREFGALAGRGRPPVLLALSECVGTGARCLELDADQIDGHFNALRRV